MRHGIEPPKAETLQKLGTELGKLRYDALLVVLTALSSELLRQSVLDYERGHLKLSQLGGKTVESLGDVLGGLGRMLKLSAPHMRDDIAKRPLRK